ncbi:MAG: putative lipid II flippase FtsW [Anaerovoracaceae bacterium]
MAKKKKRKYRINISKNSEELNRVDFPLLLLTLGLLVFGIVMVFSASYYWSLGRTGKPYAYLFDEIKWVIAGLVVMFVTSRIDYKWYRNISIIALGGSLLLLMLLFTPLGHEVKGATRWLNVGITIMPGEIAKLAVIIVVASFLSNPKKDITNLKTTVLPLLFMCGAYGALIMLQPNMSTAVTVVGIIISMMLIAGMKMTHFGGIAALGVAAGVALIFVGNGYRAKRFLSFMDPFKDALGDGFQVVQSLLALGSGGLTGRGLGNSVQKNLYLPEPQNDFILAIIGEELGFIGILVLIIAYILLIWRGLYVAYNAPDKLGFLLAAGVMMMIGIQLVLNIAVVTSSMPPTGVTLPFVSYGGNAMLLFCASIGIVLNVSKQVGEKKKKEMEDKAEKETYSAYEYKKNYMKNKRNF